MCATLHARTPPSAILCVRLNVYLNHALVEPPDLVPCTEAAARLPSNINHMRHCIAWSAALVGSRSDVNLFAASLSRRYRSAMIVGPSIWLSTIIWEPSPTDRLGWSSIAHLAPQWSLLSSKLMSRTCESDITFKLACFGLTTIATDSEIACTLPYSCPVLHGNRLRARELERAVQSNNQQA